MPDSVEQPAPVNATTRRPASNATSSSTEAISRTLASLAAGVVTTHARDMDPFRLATLACPRCRAELSHGELRHCTACKGSWVPEEVLHAHLSTMTADIAPRVAWEIVHERAGLPCAQCRAPMETLRLFGVVVDRCHAHGVWFDKDELAEVLHRSTIKPPAQHPPG